MKKKNPKDPNKDPTAPAKWSSANDATLVETFRAEKLNANWGDNGPKPVVYTAAERALKGSESISGGGPKDIQAIKNRWQKV